MEVLYGAIAAVVGGLFASVFADRFPQATRAFVAFGVILITVSLAWFVLLDPWAPVIAVGLFMLVSWAVAYGQSGSSFRTKPATEWALGVWADEADLLRSLGWVGRGTWLMDVGQSSPAFTVFERPGDRTRVGMIGTAPQGGVISIDTLLDDGRGLLITLRRRSATLRPAWMFRQELKGTITELITAHDAALFLLQTHGVLPGGTVPGGPLEFERFSNRKLRRHMVRRWWLWALRPFVIRLTPSTRRPLFEQGRISRQVDRYGRAIKREPRLATSPAPRRPSGPTES